MSCVFGYVLLMSGPHKMEGDFWGIQGGLIAANTFWGDMMINFISKGIMCLYILSLFSFDEGSRNGQHVEVITVRPFANGLSCSSWEGSTHFYLESELAGRRASVVPTLARVQELT
jgi:hypothetical protein